MSIQNAGKNSAPFRKQTSTNSNSLPLHPLMEQLILDHKNLTHLIQLLESKFHHFVLANEENDDGILSTLLESMDYINVYPQTWHHPVEEEAFKLLLAKSLSDEDLQSIKKVQEQHQELEGASQELKRAFDAIAKDSVIHIRVLVKIFSDYITLQREHMECENTRVFPLMMDRLEHKEWNQISSKIIPGIDPLFKNRSKHEYHALAKLLNDYESKKE